MDIKNKERESAMNKKFIIVISVLLSLCLLTGCGNIQIMAVKEKKEIVEVTDKNLEQESYYIKNGTRFAKVYMPSGNVKGTTNKVSTGRVLYFTDDEQMVPVHYRGELIAYSSKTADFNNVTLERFRDMQYSIGLYGGYIGDDGYYHIKISDKNIVPGSYAESIFNRVISSEVRIVSIGGDPIGELVDPGSGIIMGLSKDKYYTVEFYAGTYYYKENFLADTHFLRAFEVYNFGISYISDTTHGYMCFNTPDNLKSGWYAINGAGLFLYYDFTKEDAVALSEEDLNEGYYSSNEEMVATYSKQYKVHVPKTTKDMKIAVTYGDTGLSEGDFSASVFAPDGTEYEMILDTACREISLSLAYAVAGDWNIYIYPQTLPIENVSISNIPYGAEIEETVCEEVEFVLEEDAQYQRFYADVSGEGKVYGSVIGPDGITYSLSLQSVKDKSGNSRRYLIYDLPYAYAGQYKVKIYHYLSDSVISNIQMSSYNDSSTEIIIIE